jgi:hypothetical protein
MLRRGIRETRDIQAVGHCETLWVDVDPVLKACWAAVLPSKSTFGHASYCASSIPTCLVIRMVEV